MITISIINKTETHVPEERLREAVLSTVLKHTQVENAELEVVLVDRAEMLEYVSKYLHEEGEEAAEHPVLSFVQDEMEGPFQFPPDNITHLGEVIVSVPHAEDDAKRGNTSVEKAIIDLAVHGTLHLLGVHHD